MSEVVGSAIKQLAQRRSLSEQESAEAFDAVMRGEATPVQVSALLMALRVKGETADEVAGAANALRRAMIRVDARDSDSLVDTCGTGGGLVGTFNISTAAAFVAAGAGARVAKHGNRSFTSKCGSADVLEALGVSIDLPVDRLAGVLESAGIMFMFAPTMHPAMRHAVPIRRELGVPTVMNIIGPLANPARVRRQVVGAADPQRLTLLADALARLGTIHSWVAYGEPGLDELSPLGLSTVIEVRGGETREFTLDPAAYGLRAQNASELAGSDPAFNAALIEQILDGEGPVGARNAVILNAAAAIHVGGKAPDLGAGVELARSSISTGAARAALERLRAATNA